MKIFIHFLLFKNEDFKINFYLKKNRFDVLLKIGVTGFEPATSPTRRERTSHLCNTPIVMQGIKVCSILSKKLKK